MREALRDILPTLFACLVLLDGLFSRRRHAETAKWLSAGMGQAVFSFRLAAHAETEAVAEDGRCCMRARCVITERTSQVAAKVPCGRPRPHIYRVVVQPVCRKGDPQP
jgi:hypothetical protein